MDSGEPKKSRSSLKFYFFFLMKLKQLEQYLQDVPVFSEPKLQLEQYPTPPHLAACILYEAQHRYGDITDRSVLDLGCGCGILSTAACLLGSGYTLGVDIDPDALHVAKKNAEEFEIDLEFMLADIRSLPSYLHPKKFDTVLMNPPFGTKNNWGLDMLFLQAGCEIVKSGGAVYSLHKTSTRTHVLKKAQGWGFRGEVVAELKYNLADSYAFHKRKSVDIEVDCLRFSNLQR